MESLIPNMKPKSHLDRQTVGSLLLFLGISNHVLGKRRDSGARSGLDSL